MILFLLFQVLPVFIVVGVVLRIANVNNNPGKRKKLLAKHKREKGESAYVMYSKFYTPQYFRAWCFIALGWALFTVSDIIRAIQGRHSILALMVGGLGLCLAVVGGTMAANTWKGLSINGKNGWQLTQGERAKKRSQPDDDDW